MKLIGIMPARNEEWIIGFSARVALEWCDELVVLDHASTDRTAEILLEMAKDPQYSNRLTVVQNPRADWDEMSHRQALLEMARASGATHIAIVDADEVLTWNVASGMRQRVAALGRRELLQVPLYNLRGGIRKYHANGLWSRRWVSLAFKDDPSYAWTGDQYHHREPMILGSDKSPWKVFDPIPHDLGGVMHFWGASEARLIAKHRFYKVTERLRWPHKAVAAIEAEYNQAVHDRPPMHPAMWQFTQMPAPWLDGWAHFASYLHLHQTPWQDAYVDALILEHGRSYFEGLSI